MDPLTTFSLAASIVQFVSFAGALLKKSIEIYNSASGLPDSIDIEDAYHQLTGFTSSLRDGTDLDHKSTEIDRAIWSDVQSIRALARSCESYCATLLGIVDKVRVEDGRGRRIKSLRAALMALRKDGEMKQLEKRLAEAERQITLYLCRISSYCHEQHTKALEDLQQKAAALAIDQHARFNAFESSLDQIRIIITTHTQQNTMRIPELLRVADIENIRGLLAKVALSEQDGIREHKVLTSLLYDHYLDRYQSINPAHAKTFSWVFNPANKSSEGNRLAQWLRQGQGVFWITGKPGSGKSTMMKFLCDDAQTITALQEWACGRKLTIVSHYFWLSGTMMQKSQEGLLRSLLHGIFQRCPELIEKVCHERWAAVGQHGGIENRQPHWTLNELLVAISSISKIPQFGSKFCIFIDGLDEYQGDHIEMCDTIQKLGTTLDMKFCVSSRPWNDFEVAFGGGPNLVEMHQLTRGDILEFTNARLTEHWAWAAVSTNTKLAVSLIDLILRHAEGVFLWVVLVVRQLREGLSNYDSLEDLYRRVEGFPSDLGQFFMHILDSVDEFYHAKMATALQISLAATQPLELPVYYFLEQEHTDLNYALHLPPSRPTKEAAEQRCTITEKRLKGWCKGLLEVQRENGLEVHFLHRTVRDFLQLSDIVAFLKAKAPVHFSADLSIMKAYTAWMKSRTFYDKPECIDDNRVPIPSQFETPFRWMTAGLLSAAYQIQCKHDHIFFQEQIDAYGCMDEFERSALELENQGQLKFVSVDCCSDDKKWAADIWRENLFEFDLVLYLTHKITNNPGYLSLSGINRYIEAFIYAQQPHSFYTGFRNALKRVLESGVDPNEQACPHDTSSSMFATLMLGCRRETRGTLDSATTLTTELAVLGDKLAEELHWRKQLIRLRLTSLFLEFGANANGLLNAARCNPCLLMIAIPLEAGIGAYDGDTYLLELDCLFDHGADSEVKVDTPTSAREWFFDELRHQWRLDRSWNHEVIGQVAIRLLRRVEDKAEAEAAWSVLERALPHSICQRIKGAEYGSKRKRSHDEEQREDGVKGFGKDETWDSGVHVHKR